MKPGLGQTYVDPNSPLYLRGLAIIAKESRANGVQDFTQLGLLQDYVKSQCQKSLSETLTPIASRGRLPLLTAPRGELRIKDRMAEAADMRPGP